jgi:hypothetical protein
MAEVQKLIAADSAEAKFVQDFCQFEKTQNCQGLNKDDNKKLLSKNYKKADIKDWMKKYESTSRILYRGCWLFDFVHVVFNGINTRRGDKLFKIAQDAYKTALAPHHGFVLKKVANVAMNACVKKEKFMAGIIDQ